MAAPAGLLHGLVPNSMHLGRSGISSENRRLKRGEDGGGILVDHGEKGARGSFRCPAPSFPMLDGVKAEAENVREASLSHAKLVANAFGEPTASELLPRRARSRGRHRDSLAGLPNARGRGDPP
jgi:hypothetical protein